MESIGYVFEQIYEKYVFYDMTFMFGMFIIAFVKCFIPRKILKAYYGFRVLYVFPFPSAGHWPFVLGRDKVSIRALIAIDEIWCIVLCFLSLLQLLGWKISLSYPCSSIPLFEFYSLSFPNDEKSSELSCCWTSIERWTFLAGRSSS